MTDINEWNIQYSRFPNDYFVRYDFGSMADDTPFAVQMEIGDADIVTNDQPHGTDDATLMGRDQVLGLDLTFQMVTVPDPANPAKMLEALDKVSEFEAIWRAQGLRDSPGNYAELTNKLRSRTTIGRPRNFARKHGRGMRQGSIGFTALFRTVTPYWYKFPMNEITIPPAVDTEQEILGDAPAFPIITFRGPFDTASVRWSPGTFLTPWTLTVNHALEEAEEVTVDTRPFVRSATGPSFENANGWLAGSAMSKCFMSPSVETFPLPLGQFRLSTTGTIDETTAAVIAWPDTHAGL